MTSTRPVVSVPLPLIRLSRVALAAAALDLVSKVLATKLWSVKALHLTNWLSLALIQNHGGAFGLSAGSYTWQLNLALTLAAIVFVIPVTRDLTSVDPDAPVALGLIVGGALGNLVSLIGPPAGVADFIAIHWSASRGLVLNVADLAAYTGLAMILRTGFRIAGALVAETRRTAPLGSLYSAKADAKRQLRRIRIERTPEVVVTDWNNVADLGVVLADAPEAPDLEPVAPKSRRQRIVSPILEVPPPSAPSPRPRDD